MISNKNFSNMPVGDIPVDLEYSKCNFSRSLPVDTGGVMRGTRLFPGDDTPRTFVECNLTNCEPPPGSSLTECNTHIVNNSVVKAVNRVYVDGVEVGRQTMRENRHYGRYNPDIEAYDDFPTPIITEGKTR